ncbi:MAG TPA: hypothetical protein VHE79_04340 [Spirochaetia bacterium]
MRSTKESTDRDDALRGADVLVQLDPITAPRGWTLQAGPANGAVTLAPEGASSLADPHRALTLLVRLRSTETRGGGAELRGDAGPGSSAGGSGRFIVSEADPRGNPRFSITVSADGIVVDVFTDYRLDPIRLVAPPGQRASVPGRADAARRAVVVRYTGPHVELFVDGALVDEDWPIGVVGGTGSGRLVIVGAASAGARETGHGAADTFAAWNRALDDGEIATLCGRGPSRRGTISHGRGPSQETGLSRETVPCPSPQYARAPGGGNVGDCFPFFHDGTYHFYYLLDRRHHESKFGLGAHQWAHSSSRDLVHWESHPLAVPITEEREGSICTGSIFFHEGTWYAFYATRILDRSEHLSLAIGSDGTHFTKVDPNPFASPRPPYRGGPFRDPHVFPDPARKGLFHMLVTAELESPSVPGRGGCLAHLTSTDLRAWEQRDPFLVTGYGDQPECSELFEWRGWHYLVFSHYGVAHYRMARDPFGPWTRPPADTLDGPLARVMKSAPFTGDRRIGAFFVAEGLYAGRSVFRELVQHPDGTLGSSWPREMVPPAGEPLGLSLEALGEGIGGDPSRIVVESPRGIAAAALSAVPRRFLLTARARMMRPGGVFGIGVRDGGGFRGARLLEIAPSRRRLGWRSPGRPSWQEEETAALYEVDGLEEPFTLELVVLDEVLDLCIDGRRTLIDRAEMGDGDRLFFYCHECAAVFDGIVVRPLTDL